MVLLVCAAGPPEASSASWPAIVPPGPTPAQRCAVTVLPAGADDIPVQLADAELAGLAASRREN